MPDDGAPYVETRDLEDCIGLALGSPARFGNMTAAMKYFWNITSGIWIKHALVGKPAVLFTSSSNMHGHRAKAGLDSIKTLRVSMV